MLIFDVQPQGSTVAEHLSKLTKTLVDIFKSSSLALVGIFNLGSLFVSRKFLVDVSQNTGLLLVCTFKLGR